LDNLNYFLIDISSSHFDLGYADTAKVVKNTQITTRIYIKNVSSLNKKVRNLFFWKDFITFALSKQLKIQHNLI